MNAKRRNTRRGIAMETAIYVMTVVFIMLSTIMFLAVSIADGDKKNMQEFDIKSGLERIGEEFAAGPIDPDAYPGYTVELSDDGKTALIRSDENDRRWLRVTVEGEGENRRAVGWTYTSGYEYPSKAAEETSVESEPASEEPVSESSEDSSVASGISEESAVSAESDESITGE